MSNIWRSVLLATGFSILYCCYVPAAVYLPNSDTQTEEITTLQIGNTNSLDGAWHQDSKGLWWQYSDGSFASNKWEFIDSHWFCFNPDGYLLTGWQYIHANWYYLNPGTIPELPIGAMATGWQSIRSESYSKDFDYFFSPDGSLTFSPSEVFVTYGHALDDHKTVSRAQSQASYLQNAGISGKTILNQPASDVLNSYNSIENCTSNLNSGLFICNGYGSPSEALFSDNTRLNGVKPQTDRYTSLKGHAMKNCKIALFFGSETGAEGTTENRNAENGDLLACSQTEGALGAFGYKKAVVPSSDDKFSVELVHGLADGKTLRVAALTARSAVPVYDNCRSYRILGGNTRFNMAAKNYSIEELYMIPEDETYEFYNRIDGYETYVQTINGIMTSDYYIVSSAGDIVDLRDEISNSDVTSNPILQKVDGIRTLENSTGNTIDIYEKIDKELRLIRITKKVHERSTYNFLSVQVKDLKTGKDIPYEKVLESYKSRTRR